MTQLNEQQERDCKTAVGTVSDYAEDLMDAIADAEKAMATNQSREDVADKVQSMFGRLKRLTERGANAQAWFDEARGEWSEDGGERE